MSGTSQNDHGFPLTFPPTLCILGMQWRKTFLVGCPLAKCTGSTQNVICRFTSISTSSCDFSRFSQMMPLVITINFHVSSKSYTNLTFLLPVLLQTYFYFIPIPSPRLLTALSFTFIKAFYLPCLCLFCTLS